MVASRDDKRIAYLQAALARHGRLALPFGEAALGLGLEAIGQPLRLRRDPVAAEDLGPDEGRGLAAGGRGPRRGAGSTSWAAGSEGREPGATVTIVAESMAADAAEALARSPTRRLVVLGGPGSGKTTTIKQLIVSAAHTALADAGAPLPVYIPLADLARADFALQAYLGAVTEEQGVGTDAADALRVAVEHGTALICLDGLDEVVPALRSEALARINAWVARPGNTWIVGSRFTEYKGGQFAHARFAEWEVLPLSRDQRLELARRLLPAFGRFAAAGAATSAALRLSPTGFVEALDAHPWAGSWAGNPLLFSLAAGAFARRGALPESRAALYGEVVAGVLATREPDLARRAALCSALGAVAMRAHATKGRAFTRAELEETLPELLPALPAEGADGIGVAYVGRIIGSGVVEVVARETYSFRHQTFQEYLAVVALAAKMTSADASERADGWEMAWAKRTYSRWTEALRLLVGVLAREHGPAGREAAGRWVQRLLGQRRAPDGDPGALGLALAIRSLGEWGGEEPPVELAQEVAEAWAGETVAAIRAPSWPRLQRLLPLGEEIARFPAPAVEVAVDALARLLDSTDEDLRLRAVEALLPFGERAPVGRMARALCAGQPFARSQVLRALSRTASPALASALAFALLGLLSGADAAERAVGAEALGHLGPLAPTDAHVALRAALADADLGVRAAAVLALARLGDDEMMAAGEELAVLVLPAPRWPGDEVPYERFQAAERAVEALGLAGERGIPGLLRALARDESGYGGLRADALRALGGLGAAAPVDPLVRALRDECAHVRMAAAWALGRLGERAPFEPLLAATRDPDRDVRRSALQALRALGEGGIRVAPAGPILGALRDGDPWVRRDALAALACVEGPVPLGAVRALLDDPDHWVRADAARALACHDALDADAVARLVRIAPSADDEWLRHAAAEVLRALGPRAPLDALVALLRDPFDNVRHVGASALGARPLDAPVGPLLDALDDPADYVRWSVGEALAALGERVPPNALLDRLAASGCHPDQGLLLALGALSPRPPAEVVRVVLGALARADTLWRVEASYAEGPPDEDAGTSWAVPHGDREALWMGEAEGAFWQEGSEAMGEGEPPGAPADEPDSWEADPAPAGADGWADLGEGPVDECEPEEMGHGDATSPMRAAVRVVARWADDVVASSGAAPYLRVIVEEMGDLQDAGPIAQAILERLDAAAPAEEWLARLRDGTPAERAKAAAMLGRLPDARARPAAIGAA